MGVTGARDHRQRRAGWWPARGRPGRTCRSASASASRNGAQAAEVAAFADGVIVGSAFVRALLEGRGADGVRALTADLAEGVAASLAPRPGSAP